MDIKAAFDTINQDRMLEVVSNLLDVVSNPFSLPACETDEVGPRLLSHALLPTPATSE